MKVMAKHRNPFRMSMLSRWLFGLTMASLTPALFLQLIAGTGQAVLGLLGAMGLYYLCILLMGRADAQDAAAEHGVHIRRKFLPYRLATIFLTGLSVVSISGLATADSLTTTIIQALLASFGMRLMIGKDMAPGPDRLEESAARLGVSAKRARAQLRDASDKIQHISELARVQKDPTIKARLDEAVDEAWVMLAYLEDNPDQLAHARHFLITYLDAIERLARDINGLSKQEDLGAKRDQLLHLLVQTREALARDRAAFAERQRIDLEVSMTWLGQILTEHRRPTSPKG
ncbi:MAG TPA: hypothetical protein DHV49_05975 [Alphaproteobacteria bacterium]|nr:hypothetical protein [Alphaproteobacteria bacterium]